MNKLFSVLWSALVIVQVCFSSGCNQATKDLTANQLSSNPSVGQNSGEVGNPDTDSDSVRVSRAFFYRELRGQLLIQQGDSPGSTEVQARQVSWKEYAPTAPAPEAEEVIADFRSRQGCADYAGIGTQPIALCFEVVPDISSVGVNSREVTARGIDSLIEERTGRSVSSVNFVEARRSGESGDALEVSFLAIAGSGSPSMVTFMLLAN